MPHAAYSSMHSFDKSQRCITLAIQPRVLQGPGYSSPGAELVPSPTRLPLPADLTRQQAAALLELWQHRHQLTSYAQELARQLAELGALQLKDAEAAAMQADKDAKQHLTDMDAAAASSATSSAKRWRLAASQLQSSAKQAKQESLELQHEARTAWAMVERLALIAGTTVLTPGSKHWAGLGVGGTSGDMSAGGGSRPKLLTEMFSATVLPGAPATSRPGSSTAAAGSAGAGLSSPGGLWMPAQSSQVLGGQPVLDLIKLKKLLLEQVRKQWFHQPCKIPVMCLFV